MQRAPELHQLPANELPVHLTAQIHGFLHLVRLAVGVESLPLLLVYGAGFVLYLRVAEDQTFLQLVYHRLVQADRVNEIAGAIELDEVEAAERRCVLVLPSSLHAETETLGLKGDFGDFICRPAIEA